MEWATNMGIKTDQQQGMKHLGVVSHLHSLRRGVVVVVVRLVVLIPVITRLDTIEVARFSGTELVVPPVRLQKRNNTAFSPRAYRGESGEGRHIHHGGAVQIAINSSIAQSVNRNNSSVLEEAHRTKGGEYLWRTQFVLHKAVR